MKKALNPPGGGAAPVPGLGASLRCQGIPGPCDDVTWVRAPASCACLSVHGSVPLKLSSAQLDPPPARLCVKQRNKELDAERLRAERGAVAARRRQPSNGIISR
ncbi:hypothetical protein PBY51_006159 [Eleginops maclovinus]|uniref:Uncharacterized protein n=1 Tax=Eleginops maclovinus TaxID=56733 RepID=A0AAN7WTE9_ELEMC|nr:hypothetical protein PBY51_006159 [Eleginops maclovinus]